MVVQGHDIELIGVKRQVVAGDPALDRARGFAVRARKVCQVVANVLDTSGVDAGCGHVGHLDVGDLQPHPRHGAQGIK
ncbi:hypothetical protein D3C77_693020 [compost metagenome]